MKIYDTLKHIYGYCDTFNSIVEADGKYERISFKGCKDKSILHLIYEYLFQIFAFTEYSFL